MPYLAHKAENVADRDRGRQTRTETGREGQREERQRGGGRESEGGRERQTDRQTRGETD